MVLGKSINVEDNKVTARVWCKELGSTDYTADEEKDQLHDFIHVIQMRNINFTEKMKYEDKAFKFCDESDDTADTVKLAPVDRTVTVDETLDVSVTIDSTKLIANSANQSIKTKELMAQAQAELFIKKMVAAVTEQLLAIRAQQPDVEMEDEEIV